MRGNTQFPVASHILALVGIVEFLEERRLTSAEIANSVNTNPVVIRRIIALLKSGGLVSVRPGVGGVELMRSPKDITLLNIYKAVQADEAKCVFDLHENVNPKCQIASVFNSVLSGKLDIAQQKMEEELAKTSLLDLMQEIGQRNGVKIESKVQEV